MINPYEFERVKIKVVIEEAPGLKTFILGEEMDFKPGQFVMASVLGFGESAISLSSYPDAQITVNEVGNVTKAISRLKAGDNIGIRGPYGNSYPLDYMKGKNLLLISGGCGLAPIRSLIKYYEKNRNEVKSMHLFFGARSPEMIPFKEEINGWMKELPVHITVDKAGKGWKGNVGLVTEMLKAFNFPKDSVAVFCGPPVMFKFTAEILKSKGIKEDDMMVSLERNMRCGIGKCLHCNVGPKLVCKDGPVFRWSEIKALE